MKKVLLEDSRRIRIFLLSEFLLVGFISIPLFVRGAESGSGLVMAASVVFMWLPALATLITRKLTDDKRTSSISVRERLESVLPEIWTELLFMMSIRQWIIQKNDVFFISMKIPILLALWEQTFMVHLTRNL